MAFVFLLVGSNEQNDHWCDLLREAMVPLGQLEIHQVETVMECLSQKCYGLVIVDASTVNDVPKLVSRLRKCQPELPVVVVTAAPTWRQAREVFRAGAVDCIRKTSNEKELVSAFSKILARIAPA